MSAVRDGVAGRGWYVFDMSGNFARMLRVVPSVPLLHVVESDGSLALDSEAATNVLPAARTDAELVVELRREIEGLREAMESRATIEQAKGMVMLCYGLPPDEAFAVLARWSSLHNVKLWFVAASIARMAQRAPLGDAGPVLARELTAELQAPPP